MKKTFLLLLGAIVLVGGGCFGNDSASVDEGPVEIDRDAILFEAKQQGLIMSDDESAQMVEGVSEDAGSTPEGIEQYLNQDFSEWSSAALADVTGGGSYGIAHAAFISGQYQLVVEMGNVPDLAEGYFYEGWIVRRGANMSVISTGVAEIVEDKLVNVYMSNTNLTDHDFYVLTLEPDDGDPAPAEHILEGTLK